MANAATPGPAPNRLYVLKNDYEIRYYTTPETFAQGILDYGSDPRLPMEPVVYARVQEAPILEDLQAIVAAEPAPQTPNLFPGMSPQAIFAQHVSLTPLTPQQKAQADAYEKQVKKWRKVVRTKLLEVVKRY